MQLTFRRLDLELAHRWTIARSLGPDGSGGSTVFEVVLIELVDDDGVMGLGEAAPSARYQENVGSTMAFLRQVDATRLSFEDFAGSMNYIDSLGANDGAAKGAINIALLDGAAKKRGQPIYDLLKLGFIEKKHITSFSIGIDQAEIIRRKVLKAEPYPILKLKVGGPDDRQNLATLRDAAPTKTVRVDANEGWKTKEEALKQIEGMAGDGHVQFVEQPMPASTAPNDLGWRKTR